MTLFFTLRRNAAHQNHYEAHQEHYDEPTHDYEDTYLDPSELKPSELNQDLFKKPNKSDSIEKPGNSREEVRTYAQEIEINQAEQVAEKVVDKLEERRFKMGRLACKYLYLTYPMCSLTPTEVLHFLSSVFKKENVDQYVIAKEIHQSGAPHIHGWVRLSNQCDIRNPNKLYIPKGNTEYWKGNFQVMKDPTLVLKYVTKELNNDTNGQASTEERKQIYVTNLDLNSYGFLTDPYKKAIALAEGGNIAAALALLEKTNTKDYLLNLTKYKQHFTEFAKQKLWDKSFEGLKKEDFDYPPGIIKWFENDTQRYSLYLSGPANSGKTRALYALLQHLNPLVVRNRDNLKRYDPTLHKCLIFDDLNLSFAKISQKRNFFDTNQDATLRLLYCTIMIPSGTVRVFTSNVRFEEAALNESLNEKPYNADEKGSLLRRTFVYHTERCFIKNQKELYLAPTPLIWGPHGEIENESLRPLLDYVNGIAGPDTRNKTKIEDFPGTAKNLTIPEFGEKQTKEDGRETEEKEEIPPSNTHSENSTALLPCGDKTGVSYDNPSKKQEAPSSSTEKPQVAKFTSKQHNSKLVDNPAIPLPENENSEKLAPKGNKKDTPKKLAPKGKKKRREGKH